MDKEKMLQFIDDFMKPKMFQLPVIVLTQKEIERLKKYDPDFIPNNRVVVSP